MSVVCAPEHRADDIQPPGIELHGLSCRWRLALSDSKKKSDCLKIRLEPSAKNDTCSLSIIFGEQQVTVPVSTAQKKKQ